MIRHRPASPFCSKNKINSSNIHVANNVKNDGKIISPSCKSTHSLPPDTVDPVHEHPHEPTIHNLSDETSSCLIANNLEQNVSSENEKVIIEQAYAQSMCLTAASWSAPILQKKNSLACADHQAKEMEQNPNQSLSLVSNNEKCHMKS